MELKHWQFNAVGSFIFLVLGLYALNLVRPSLSSESYFFLKLALLIAISLPILHTISLYNEARKAGLSAKTSMDHQKGFTGLFLKIKGWQIGLAGFILLSIMLGSLWYWSLQPLDISNLVGDADSYFILGVFVLFAVPVVLLYLKRTRAIGAGLSLIFGLTLVVFFSDFGTKGSSIRDLSLVLCALFYILATIRCALDEGDSANHEN